MNTRPRGFLSLSAVLGLVGLVSVLGILLLSQVERARLSVMRQKARVSSECLARSGLEYARAALRSHRWAGAHPEWTSPRLGIQGYFRVAVRRDGNSLVIRSTGVATGYPQAEERTLEERP